MRLNVKKLNRDSLPDWWQGLNTENGLILTNDLDSLFACAVLKKIYGCNIVGFYDFKQMAFCDKPKNLVGVDLDMSRGKCFSNHKTYYQNDNAINLNTLQPDTRYGRKYPLSTTMLVLWLVNYPFCRLTDEQLKVLISIDSGYLWHYGKDWNREVHAWWLESMGLDAFTDMLNRTSKDEFEVIKKKYNLDSTIQLHAGRLHSAIRVDAINELFGFDMELPKDIFKTHTYFKNIQLLTWQRGKLNDGKDICFSNAMVSKDSVKLSLIQ